MLAERLAEARRQTDSLFDILKPEALYERPVAERHRIVFYLGHLEAFDWNLLGDRPVHAEFDKLFAFGIDPLGEGLPTDQPRDWPSGLRKFITTSARSGRRSMKRRRPINCGMSRLSIV
jgi:gamma-glutamyl hercynylcysteine S-oxide synthase